MSATRKLAGVVVAALTWASLAFASATPVTPKAGTIVATTHPVFTWTVPEGETTTGVYVSSSRARTPSGAFPAANVVDSQVLSQGELRWSPTRPMFAGAYFWSVKTHNAESKDLYSAPRSFGIKASGSITSLRLTRFTDSHHLLVTLKWRANSKNSAVTVRIKRAGKLVWSTKFSLQAVVPDQEGSGIKTWERPARIPQGAKVTLTATLQANSFTRTLTRPVRAP